MALAQGVAFARSSVEAYGGTELDILTWRRDWSSLRVISRPSAPVVFRALMSFMFILLLRLVRLYWIPWVTSGAIHTPKKQSAV